MKSYTMLNLYDALLNGDKVNRSTFCVQFNICERTFYRYIKEIGEFLMHCKSDYVIAVDSVAMLDNNDCAYYFVKV
ncbi:MAG: hypothetical protein K2O31_01375 [Clostridia bacterium]|nr:hypothetical protein [Clostridia bacterium]